MCHVLLAYKFWRLRLFIATLEPGRERGTSQTQHTTSSPQSQTEKITQVKGEHVEKSIPTNTSTCPCFYCFLLSSACSRAPTFQYYRETWCTYTARITTVGSRWAYSGRNEVLNSSILRLGGDCIVKGPRRENPSQAIQCSRMGEHGKPCCLSQIGGIDEK